MHHCRKPDGAAMAERITATVNSVLAEEAAAGPLSESDVLGLIDLGKSEGGSQVCFALLVTSLQ